jgi:hypothetical protein
MGKKIVLRESQLKRLLQYNTKQKLKESLEDLEPVDYNMGKQGDGNLLPNPPKELNVDVEDGKFVDYTMGKEGDENQLPNPPQEINLDIEEGDYYEGDYYEGDYYEDDSMSAEIDMETGITMEDDYSLNEGQKELKSTFNKYIGNPIIESLSSKIK